MLRPGPTPFLSRHFRAPNSPLWAIDEEDTATVTEELLGPIVRNEILGGGAALRDLCAGSGVVLPTSFSCLLHDNGRRALSRLLEPELSAPACERAHASSNASVRD